MTEHEPVLLAIYLDLTVDAWFLATGDGIGNVTPLLRSQDDDLAAWRKGTHEERMSFLRHRIAGALQRGATIIFPQNRKVSAFTVCFPQVSNEADRSVLYGVADHFCVWMIRPPVICVEHTDSELTVLASTALETDLERLTIMMNYIRNQTTNTNHWQSAPPARSESTDAVDPQSSRKD